MFKQDLAYLPLFGMALCMLPSHAQVASGPGPDLTQQLRDMRPFINPPAVGKI